MFPQLWLLGNDTSGIPWAFSWAAEILSLEKEKKNTGAGYFQSFSTPWLLSQNACEIAVSVENLWLKDKSGIISQGAETFNLQIAALESCQESPGKDKAKYIITGKSNLRDALLLIEKMLCYLPIILKMWQLADQLV